MGTRYYNLSLFRLVAVFLIILFHIYFIYASRFLIYENLLSKAIQGLAVVSGILFSQKSYTDIKSFYTKRLFRLLLPALLGIVLMMISNLIYLLINNSQNYFVLFSGYRAYNKSLLVQPANYYYIFYIFVCYLITPLLQRKDKISLTTVLLVIFSEFAFYSRYSDPLFIITSYIIGYYVGVRSFKYYVNKKEKWSVYRFLTWLTIFLICLLLYIYMAKTGYLTAWTEYSQFPRNIVQSLFGVSATFVFILIFRFINIDKDIKLFNFTDKYTYSIYLLNQAYMIGGMNVGVLSSSLVGKFFVVVSFTILGALLIHFGSSLINKRIKILSKNLL